MGSALWEACTIDLDDAEILAQHAGATPPTQAGGGSAATGIIVRSTWDTQACYDDFPDGLYTLLAAFAHLGHSRSAQLLGAVHARRTEVPRDSASPEGRAAPTVVEVEAAARAVRSAAAVVEDEPLP